ncbi:MAG: dioxygenase, partial [Chlorobium sp.]
EGILIVGSGNIVHNLRAYVWGDEAVPPFDWALRFEAGVRRLILEGREGELAEFSRVGNDARLSVPSPDHFLPLLYVMGLRREGEEVRFPVEGIEGGSLSMLSVQIG